MEELDGHLVEEHLTVALVVSVDERNDLNAIIRLSREDLRESLFNSCGLSGDYILSDFLVSD